MTATSTLQPETPAELDAFREEVRAFIRQALPEDLRARVQRGYTLLTREDHSFWQKQLYARGWAAPNWPVEYGGTGWSAARQQIFDDECGRASCPRTQPGGIKLVGPIIFTYGTEAQKKRFLDPILKADEWWCQGYSEPNAGSDLASLSTRAVLEGDHYRVNGQKVWTTLAHWADWMFCLVRTDSSGRRQEGITFLLIDMKTPGITLRPIKTLDLAHHTNEVFLQDVMVPVANRIGEEGRGWTYAKALLAHERAGIAELGRSRERLDRLKRLAGDHELNGDALLRDESFRAQVAQLEVEILAAEATTLRVLEDHNDPALSSVLKLRGSEITQKLSRMNMLALGPHALRLDLEAAERGPRDDDPLSTQATGRSVEYLRWRSLTVAGGTSEIQRNIIAKLAFNGLGSMPSNQQDAQFEDSVNRFVRDQEGVETWRDAVRECAGFRPDVWKTFADLGWLAVGIPEDFGGLGMGAREVNLIMRGLGKALVSEPYWSTAVFGTQLILAAGTLAQKQQWLPQIAEGRLRLAVALMEPGTRFEWHTLRCSARRVGHDWRISGRKIAVLDGALADRLLVPARTEEGEALLFCLAADAPGITRRDTISLDERWSSDYVFDDVRVAEDQRLSGAASLQAAMQPALAHARAALAAEAVGAMEAAVHATIEYLKTRKQFGQTLSEFQVLRHRVADMVMALEQTRSLAGMAARLLDEKSASAQRLALAAKVQAGQAGCFVGENSVQLHGGIGVTDELHVGHYLKRLLCIDILLGDSGYSLKAFAQYDPHYGPHHAADISIARDT